jgi:hypothetical protein
MSSERGLLGVSGRWLTAVLIVSILSLVGIGRAWAAAPQRGTIQISSEDGVDGCTDPLLVRQDGVERLTEFVGAFPGGIRLLALDDVELTIENLTTGETITGTSARATSHFFDVEAPTVNPDGSITFHDEFRGLFRLFVVPGEGVVFLRAGVFRLDVTLTSDGRFVESAFWLVAGSTDNDLCDLF